MSAGTVFLGSLDHKVCVVIFQGFRPMQRIPTVAFICNNANYGTRIPFCITQLGFTAVLGQKFCNLSI